jgi:hypothetical protein
MSCGLPGGEFRRELHLFKVAMLQEQVQLKSQAEQKARLLPLKLKQARTIILLSAFSFPDVAATHIKFGTACFTLFRALAASSSFTAST